MNPLLAFHIAVGSAALAAGGAALALPKGSTGHRLGGIVFAATMLAMAASGGIAAVALGAAPKINTLAAATSAYLVGTGWAAVRSSPGSVSAVDRALCVGGFATVILGSSHAAASIAEAKPISALTLVVFTVIALRGALLDLSIIRAGGLPARRRLPRHLWRMCAAFAIAAFAFFVGQQDEFPEAVRSPLWALAPLSILGAMAWWMAKLRPRAKVAA